MDGSICYDMPGRGGNAYASHHLPQRIRVGDPLIALRGAWAGERCHILGNGPSLLEADLAGLGGERVIGVNASPLVDGRLGRPADLYCVSDRRFLLDPDKLRIARMATGSVRVFAGYCAGLIEETDIQYVRILGGLGASADPLAGVYHGGSVVCFAAQIALWTGAAQIVLHGCEFDYGQGRFYEPGRPDPRSLRLVQRCMWLIVHAAGIRRSEILCAGRSRLLGDMGDRPVPGLRRAVAPVRAPLANPGASGAGTEAGSAPMGQARCSPSAI